MHGVLQDVIAEGTSLNAVPFCITVELLVEGGRVDVIRIIGDIIRDWLSPEGDLRLILLTGRALCVFVDLAERKRVK